VLLKWARLARLPANQAEESTIASAPFSAEFGTLVVIHDPELRDVAGVTRGGRAARLSRRSLRADSNGFLLPRVRSVNFKHTSVVLHQLIVSPGASGQVPIRIERP
jgi:hypothetical protein